MSITASCGNCGKTYQAPDRLAGKSVRCKACGEIFRVDPPTDFDPSGAGNTNLDLDALERSFSNADATSGGSMTATGVAGPTVDGHGKVHVRRGANVDAERLEGDDHSSGVRTNFRYRYPGAKQIDRLLPWVLVVLTLFVIIQGSLSTEANVANDTIALRPPTNVAISRASILIALYVIVIWPASHIAMTTASRRLRFAMPRAPLWRSFGGFSPVLMLGGGLFILSGGEPAALIMGIVVGIALAIGAVAVLFRIFPNEVPIVGAFAGGGAAIGSAFAIAITIAVNLVAVSVAKTDPNRTLSVSPIGVGMPWVAPPPVVAVKPSAKVKQPIASTTTAPTTPSATDPNGTDPNASPDGATLQVLALPTVPAGEPRLLRALELAPVKPGFDAVLVPAITSDAIGVVRASNGGRLESWDRVTWKRPTEQVGRDFDATRNPLFFSPSGMRVIRLVSNPVDRLEQLPLGNQDVLAPVRVTTTTGESERVIVALLSDDDVLCSVRTGSILALERYVLSEGSLSLKATALKSGGQPITFEAPSVRQALRLLPDGKGVLIACREVSSDGSVDARLLRYDIAHLNQPAVACDVPLNRDTAMAPAALAIDATGDRAALLLDTGGELNLTVWDISLAHADAATSPRSSKLDRKIGLTSSLKPNGWDDSLDPIVWLDARTLMVYGRLIVDAQSGRSLGQTNIANVVGQLPHTDAAGHGVLIVNRGEGKSLVRVTFDTDALAAARQ